jgi:hypothetical protein
MTHIGRSIEGLEDWLRATFMHDLASDRALYLTVFNGAGLSYVCICTGLDLRITPHRR